VNAANITGTISNATYATTAGSATTATTATSANTVAGANVSGVVANATYSVSSGSTATAGTVTTAAQPNITSVGLLTSVSTSGLIVVGTSILQQAKEKTTFVAIAPAATSTFDVLSSAILYYTANMVNNVVLNIRGNGFNTFNSISNVGDSVTLALVTTCGATPYVVTGLQIDGVSVTPKYNGNVAPTVSLMIASGINTYNYTVIKTAASAYVVLGSFAGYK